jgi:hypothetical protein
MSEDISLISTHPFFAKFVFSIIENMREKNFVRDEKYIIHADLVPKVSEKTVHKSLAKPVLSRPKPAMVMPEVLKKRSTAEVIEEEKKNIDNLLAEKEKRQKLAPVRAAPEKVAPASPEPVKKERVVTGNEQVRLPSDGPVDLGDGYGQITPLLNDPTVFVVECPGAGRQVTVVQNGRKQFTNIVLGRGEVDAVLKKISEEVHIPLMEGVFRAATEGFSISAVVSKLVGSKFVLKKNMGAPLRGIAH